MDDGDVFEHVMVYPVGGGVQRLDVIASVVGRRCWTQDAKARIIAESMAAGANVAEVARRNDMQPQHLYLWRRTAREQMGSRTVPHDQPSFVPVAIEGAIRSPAAQSMAEHDGSCREIGIDL